MEILRDFVLAFLDLLKKSQQKFMEKWKFLEDYAVESDSY